MKRILIAGSIIFSGALAISGLQRATSQLRKEMANVRDAWISQTQAVTEARTQLASNETRFKQLQRETTAQQHAVAGLAGLQAVDFENLKSLDPEQCEKLLAELGFNWNTTGEYIVVSKDTLRRIRLDGMNNFRLSSAACKVLAITPEERASAEALCEQIGEDYRAWAEANVQREEPSGDVVAKYSLASDPEFSMTLSNRFVAGVAEVFGSERGNLFIDYSRSWMLGMGMYHAGLPPSPTTFSVERYDTEDDRFSFEVRQAGCTMSTDISPRQPFPQAFRALFPNGWKDLAQREGFKLPASFKDP